jgi:hypothetical protein
VVAQEASLRSISTQRLSKKVYLQAKEIIEALLSITYLDARIVFKTDFDSDKAHYAKLDSVYRKHSMRHVHRRTPSNSNLPNKTP